VNNTIIELHQIFKEYRLGRQLIRALRGIDLQVEKGEFLILSGPSGSGKTTLLNIIGCLDRPTQGELFFRGEPITRLPERRLARLRARAIGFVFQTFSLIPVMTAYENVEYPLLLMGLRRAERRRRVLALLEEVGLEGKEGRRPEELSGGEQQRVAIARALITEPQLVLADEPTAHLDSRTGEQVIRLLARLNTERGTTFILATHDPLVERLAQRALQIRDGRLLGGV
jgi:putative ABC transport system ATP-binding protein